MRQVQVDGEGESYALATGEAAAYRLRILHDLYGPGTRRVLLGAGLRPGCASRTSGACPTAWSGLQVAVSGRAL